MAKIDNFSIDTDTQIARAILKSGTESERKLRALGNLVGIEYRRQGNRIINESKANSIFDEKEQRSVLDPSSFHVDINGSTGELVLSIEAPAAQYVESGNDGAEGNEFMKIKLKSGFQPRKRKRKKSPRSVRITPDTFIKKESGRFYMYTRSVRPAKGYNLLENAVRKIFS